MGPTMQLVKGKGGRRKEKSSLKETGENVSEGKGVERWGREGVAIVT